MADGARMPWLLYIPLCLYFNYSSCPFFTHSRHFTFHYVSILIGICISYVGSVGLYIPLCLYFNYGTFTVTSPEDYFTFHYVSILMHGAGHNTSISRQLYIPLCLYFNVRSDMLCSAHHSLYIPLCLYFNYCRSVELLMLKALYIPLCLYFNKTSRNFWEVLTSFTFHYVSILIPYQ